MSDEIEGIIYEVQAHEMTALRHIRQTIEELPQQTRQIYIDLIVESSAAGRSIGLHAIKSHRRIDIATGILCLMLDEQYDAELVMGICSHITKQQYRKAGEALANLDHRQAKLFKEICQRIKQDDLLLIYNPKSNNFQIQEKAS
jgi:hypothetical protein